MGDVVMTISIGDYSVDNIKYFEDHEGIDIFKCDILYKISSYLLKILSYYS